MSKTFVINRKKVAMIANVLLMLRNVLLFVYYKAINILFFVIFWMIFGAFVVSAVLLCLQYVELLRIDRRSRLLRSIHYRVVFILYRLW